MRQEELEQYIREYGKDLYSFCRFVAWDIEEAQDLYQDTFLRFCETGDKVVIAKNPKSYLMGIAVNLYRNEKRKLSVRRRIAGVWQSVEEMDADIPENARLLEEEIIVREECQNVRRAVASLADEYRLPVLLFYMEELSLAEIAAVLRLPEGTVKSRLYRAKKILKRKLTEKQEGAEQE